MTIPMTSERVAPRDPQEKRPGFYVMLDNRSAACRATTAVAIIRST